MKFSILLLTIIVTVRLPAQVNYFNETAMNAVDESGKRQDYWRITAGMMHIGSPWFPNQIVSEGHYVDSKLEGVWVYYHQNANKSGEITYKASRKNGTAKYFNINGGIISSSEYVNGERNGIMTTYYPDGTKWTEFTWKNGTIDGPAKTYYPNGHLCEEGYWLHTAWMLGGWSGTYTLYDDKGSVLRTHY